LIVDYVFSCHFSSPEGEPCTARLPEDEPCTATLIAPLMYSEVWKFGGCAGVCAVLDAYRGLPGREYYCRKKSRRGMGLGMVFGLWRVWVKRIRCRRTFLGSLD
jgi:hypothetical protein